MVLLPAFTPDAIARLGPFTRATCRQLLKPILSRGRCDAATDYAQFIPMTVIARMLGLPDEDGAVSGTMMRLDEKCSVS
jgi:cytochrome P450